MFPDLELAVEEEVPELAISFFDMVREWVGELIALVNTTQKGNQTSINQVCSTTTMIILEKLQN
jgi:hypothetical protein